MSGMSEGLHVSQSLCGLFPKCFSELPPSLLAELFVKLQLPVTFIVLYSLQIPPATAELCVKLILPLKFRVLFEDKIPHLL